MSATAIKNDRPVIREEAGPVDVRENGGIVVPRMVEMLITPEIAQEWLALDHPNRPTRQWRVDQIASDVTADLWESNGETFKHCAEHGGLLDGKHRALGIVKADRAVISMVVFGLECKTQHTMDIGAGRTPGNTFSLEGAAQANLTAAATRIIWRIENSLEAATGPDSSPTRRQLLATWERHSGISHSVVWAARMRQVHVPESVSVAAHYWLARIDYETAELYFDRLSNGIALVPGDPELAVRRWLSTSAVSRGRTLSAAKLAVLIQGWNSVRLNERRTIVRYRSDHEFPKAL